MNELLFWTEIICSVTAKKMILNMLEFHQEMNENLK